MSLNKEKNPKNKQTKIFVRNFYVQKTARKLLTCVTSAGDSGVFRYKNE